MTAISMPTELRPRWWHPFARSRWHHQCRQALEAQVAGSRSTVEAVSAAIAGKPHPVTGHAWWCDCGDCLGDGNETQWHRRGIAHQCGESWWPGFGLYAASQRPPANEPFGIEQDEWTNRRKP